MFFKSDYLLLKRIFLDEKSTELQFYNYNPVDFFF